MTETTRAYRSVTAIFITILLVFFPINYINTYIKLLDWQTDFNLHILFAMSLKTEGINSIPPYTIAHSAWQLLIVAINLLTGFSFRNSALVVSLSCAEVTALVMFLWFLPAFNKNNLSAWKITVIILGLSIAAPISILWILDGLMYLGYVGITSYHSPTMYLLKPLALLEFILAYKCFNNSPPLNNYEIMAAGILSLSSTFVKPVLSICLLPALGIFTIYNLFQKRYVNLRAIILGFGIPIVLTLTWQFMVTYQSNDGSGVGLAPFVVMGGYSKYLVGKFLLSFLFPALVLYFNFEQARKDPRLILSWLVFGVGIFFTYFLGESGKRLGDGNFVWSGEISLFLLFAVSTLFCLDTPLLTKKSANILLTGWMLHVVFGGMYYFYCAFNNSYF